MPHHCLEAVGVRHEDTAYRTPAYMIAGQWWGSHPDRSAKDKSGFSEKPVTFRVGRGDAIPGLDRGVVGMLKGSRVTTTTCQ